ncbi:MAG TPA: hydrogenase maturation peptidase HycI [Anaerolineales bacterium]|nr:hydrogenase maturation peptidase HycI [Anaerolineales bacterium]
MKKKLVLTVGNQMMGDDAAGPMLAARMQGAPLPDWEVVDGASAPENLLYLIREMAPDQVLVVDAADMDLVPGEVRFIGAEKLQDPFLMTTHTLPLSYLVQSLREFVPHVDLLGIQPQVVAWGYPVSQEVTQAVERVYEDLKKAEFEWNCLEPSADGMDWKICL